MAGASHRKNRMASRGKRHASKGKRQASRRAVKGKRHASKAKRHASHRASKGKRNAAHRRYSGVTDEAFKTLNIPESGFTIGKNEATERKKLNAITRQNRSDEEPVLMAKWIADVETAFKQGTISESEYHSIKDDIYNLEIPDDFDAFENINDPSHPAIKDILDPITAMVGHDELNMFIEESNNNRGTFTWDKPRGPKVRLAEEAKRGLTKTAKHLASKAGAAAIVLYDKSLEALDGLGDLASAAADLAKNTVAIGTESVKTASEAAKVVKESVKVVGKTAKTARAAVKTAGHAVDAGTAAVSAVGGLTKKAAKAAAKLAKKANK